MSRARALAPSVAVALASLAVACSGVDADPGRDALLQIDGAQFVRGALPSDEGGPRVQSVDLVTTEARAGTHDKTCSGALDPVSTGVALGLAGDVGYWVLPAGVPAAATPGLPSYEARLGFAIGAPLGSRDLLVQAVDGSGRHGAVAARPLTIVGPGDTDGQLVVSLSWDTESDLDLHVVDPNGVEIYKRNIDSYEPPGPGQPLDPDGWKKGGYLDVDSNAACLIDGRRRENVVWKEAPPSGHYVARVDTFSLCQASSARWTVEARVAGVVVATARGQSFGSDTRLPHDRGAGVLALEFDVP